MRETLEGAIKMEKSLDYLIEHLNTYKDAVCILGSKATKELGIADMTLTKKMFKRQYDEFWNVIKVDYTIDAKTTPLTVTQENIKKLYDKKLIKDIFAQSIDGLLAYHDVENVKYLHGNVLTATCTNPECKTMFTNDYFMSLEEAPICERCGHTLKPDTILIGERYDNQIYLNLQEKILNTHTLLVIGLDAREQALLDLIADFGEIQLSNIDEQNLLVVIQDKQEELNYLDIAHCDFLVKDEISAATTRLADAIERK